MTDGDVEFVLSFYFLALCFRALTLLWIPSGSIEFELNLLFLQFFVLLVRITLMLHNKDNLKGFECIWIISNLFEDNEERDLIMSKTVREIAETLGGFGGKFG